MKIQWTAEMRYHTELVSVSKIKPNPANPRVIKDAKFKALVESIKAFPSMLWLRPVVLNGDGMILGGDKRLKAAKEAGFKQVPCINADKLTDEQQREFIIKDNVSAGEWDWQLLSNDWDAAVLKEWGLEAWQPVEINLEDFMKPANTREEAMKKLIFEYSEADYTKVVEKLDEFGGTKEVALFKLLGL